MRNGQTHLSPGPSASSDVLKYIEQLAQKIDFNKPQHVLGIVSVAMYLPTGVSVQLTNALNAPATF